MKHGYEMYNMKLTRSDSRVNDSMYKAFLKGNGAGDVLHCDTRGYDGNYLRIAPFVYEIFNSAVRQFNMSNLYFIEFMSDGRAVCTYEWTMQGCSSVGHDYVAAYNRDYNSRLSCGEAATANILDGCNAALRLPVTVAGDNVGIIGFEDCRRDNDWNEDEKATFFLIAQFISILLEVYTNELDIKTKQSLLSTVVDGMEVLVGVFDTETDALIYACGGGKGKGETEMLLNLLYKEISKNFAEGGAENKEQKNDSSVRKLKVTVREEELWFKAYRTPVKWQGGISACALYATDITKKEKEKYIDRHLGIPNMLQFELDIKKILKDPNQYGAVMLLDLDDFKNANDAYGYDMGDLLLFKIKAFLDSFRSHEIEYYRFAGDEFIILYKNAGKKEAEDLTRLILSRFRTPWKVKKEELFITASIGVAFYPEHGVTFNDIMRSIDVAVHHVKNDGKNNTFFFVKDLEKRFQYSFAIEKSLRHAIANDFKDFHLCYQPIINLRTGECVGAEALLRWVDPHQGIIPPAHFIPLAEKTGLIVPLGEWVLRTACEQSVIWSKKGKKDFFVSVNLSKRQVNQASSATGIKRILDEKLVSPGNIAIEITESLEIHDMDACVRFLNEIRSYGVKIAMDDFGTGYSSLGNLRIMPLDCIKIDKTFIQGVGSDNYSMAFIQSIANLAHGLGMIVCIEGLETPEQYKYSIALNCDLGQGYLFSVPLTAKEFEQKYRWD